jgi:branched-chain amino acid transport system substrate-binding protein
MSHSVLNRILVVTFAILIGATGCNKKSGEETGGAADEILVGEYGSLTGSEATFGISTKEGIEMVTEEWNAKGGIKGKKIRVIVLDNRGLPEESATAVTRLITQQKVVAVIGEVASSRSLAAAPIAQQYKVPMISPSSTNPKVTQIGDYIFRVCFIDPFQGYVMAKFTKENLKLKTAAIFRDKKSDYSEGLSNVFKEEFKKMGGTIVEDMAYQGGDVDFKSQLTAIKAKKPDAIFVPGYYTEVGLIARQARELGIKVPLLGGDGWDSVKLFQIGGKALEPSYMSNHYAVDAPSPELAEFVKKYRAKFGHDPDGLAGLGYDAALMLFDAISRAPTMKSEDIRAALAATKDLKGVTGNITIDSNRNPSKSAVVLKVLESGFKYETTVNSR